MCRKKGDDGQIKGRRCPCDSPEKRRVRQNLAYHTRKVLNMQSKVQSTHVNDSEEVSPELMDHYREIVENYTQQRKAFGSALEWILNNDTPNPENLIRGSAKREQEIRAIGSLVAERAQMIAGISYNDIQKHNNYHLSLRQESERKLEDAKDAAEKAYNVYRDLNIKKKSGEEFDSAKKYYEDMVLEESIAQKISDELVLQHEKTRNELLSRIVLSHRESISELRVKGVEPRIVSKDTHVQKFFKKEVSSVFPGEWVNEANVSEIALTTQKHLKHYKPQKKYSEEKIVARIDTKKSSDFHMNAPSPEDIRYVGWVYDKSTDSWSGTKRSILSSLSKKELQKVALGTDENGKRYPLDRSWKQGQTYSVDGIAKQEWVKDEKIKKEIIAGFIQEINVPEIKSGATNASSAFNRTAVHEYSHHLENIKPEIPRLEEAFLRRRTTVDGIREPLKRYPGGSLNEPEYVREDNFVNVYMGKEYLGEVFREVLSLGTEGVFNGTQGGFLGLGIDSRLHEDRDTIHFILGMYATI